MSVVPRVYTARLRERYITLSETTETSDESGFCILFDVSRGHVSYDVPQVGYTIIGAVGRLDYGYCKPYLQRLPGPWPGAWVMLRLHNAHTHAHSCRLYERSLTQRATGSRLLTQARLKDTWIMLANGLTPRGSNHMHARQHRRHSFGISAQERMAKRKNTPAHDTHSQ